MRQIQDLTVEQKNELINQIVLKKSGGSDKDWSDIIDQFQLDMHLDTMRRASIGVMLACQANTDLSYIERQKMRDIGNKVNAIYRQQSRSELLRECVSSAIKNLDPINFQLSLSEKQYEYSGNTLVLAMGDFHYGMECDVRGLHNETVNFYNHDVFNQRMQKLIARTIQICSHHDIQDIHIMLVGDLIDGMLRQSQLMRIEFGLVQQVIKLSEYLAQWLCQLNNMLFGKVHITVDAVTGNHSQIRPLGSKSRQFDDENLEKIIMWYLHDRLADIPNIDITPDCDRMRMVNVRGYNFVLLHGDGDKNISNIARDAVNMYGQRIDFFICGHLHSMAQYPNGQTSDGNSTVIRVPSMCGTDKYAQSKGYGGKPGAVAMLIQKEYGQLCRYPIYFER